MTVTQGSETTDLAQARDQLNYATTEATTAESTTAHTMASIAFSLCSIASSLEEYMASRRNPPHEPWPEREDTIR